MTNYRPARVALSLALTIAVLLGAIPSAIAEEAPAEVRPLMRDFIGINGHTIQVKPELYRPAGRLMRDYHNLEWDLGMDTNSPSQLPNSIKGINWYDLYGSWAKAGIEVNVCIQWKNTHKDESMWKDIPADAYRYGKSLGETFHADSGTNVTSIQIGNEPGTYSDAAYRTILINMARGIRETNPDLLIVTCNMEPKERGTYWQNTAILKGADKYYDVIATHKYPMLEHYPTWARSYPEDPRTEFRKHADDLLAWRDRNAPGKQVWVTEFGYDSSTKEPEPTGTFKDWVDVSDEHHAQWLTRGFLVFAAAGVDRAYMYFFNDSDNPSFHAASGLTRNFEPKPVYYAQRHLLATLGDYRFTRAVSEKNEGLYLYEFTHGDDDAKRVWVAWSATGDGREFEHTLTDLPGEVVKAQRMPMTDGDAEAVEVVQDGSSATLTVTESPAYLWIE